MNTPNKYSRQREAILNFLKTRKDHPTADVVYQSIREELPSISLGTVYRNLNQLSNAGTILRLHCDGTTDHFDADTQPHSHFICNCCGSVSDIYNIPLDGLMRDAALDTPNQIEDVSLLFSGTCSACLAKNEQAM